MAGESKLIRGNSSLNPNFPGNGEARPAERIKREPIAKGKILRKKKSWLQKIKDGVLGDVENQSVGDYIFYDVLVPAVKAMVVDTVVGGINMIFYGDRRAPGNLRRDGARTYSVPYNSYYNGSEGPARPSFRSAGNERYNFETITFTSRGHAEEILSTLSSVIDEYGMVSVADFYELCEIPANYTDQRYGWTSLKEAFTERIREGYVIKLPRAKPLN